MMADVSSLQELRKLVYLNSKGQKVLDLQNKYLRTIPEAVLQISDVEVLNLSHNELTVLPTDIDQLKNLTDLVLNHNRLTELPESIGNLEKLTRLELSWNRLTALPTSIILLKQLQELDLKHNKLTELPEGIGNLQKLTRLDVSWNQLTALPTSIILLKQLQELDLKHNKLTELPEAIGNLQKLTRLDVSWNQLTALPTSIVLLKQLQELDLKHNKLTELPESIGNLQKLTRLDVSWNQLTALPTSIILLKQLQELDLKHNKLTDLPESIGNLQKLTRLDVSYNQLTALPTSITQLKQLQELDLKHNKLTELPEAIGNLQKLTRLDVSWNQLTALPTSITQLKQLQRLYVNNNKLTVLPESIGNLEKLTRLELSGNQLTALPNSSTQLKQLQELDLKRNKLTELPEGIGNLQKLTRLDVSYNQLTALPTSITQLKQLEELYVNNNKLTVLPESIGNLEKLTRLELSGNQLTALPNSSTQLKQLQELDLKRNKLTELPEGIGNLQKLTRLDVSYNQLTALPTSITQLKQLEELYVNNNKLTVLPESIGNLQKLTRLDVSWNQLTALPTSITQLKQLEELDLKHNKLTVLPESIGNLEKLTRLELSGNQLTALPNSSTQLKQLQELDLKRNKLTELPEAIGNLQKLTRLDVSYNQLTALPTSITQLKQLEELYVNNNKLTVLPESIGNLQKLTRLDVSWNQLTALPTSITQLKQLEELDLKHNKLTELPEGIGNLEKLTRLGLMDNRLTALPTSITQRKLLEPFPEEVDVEEYDRRWIKKPIIDVRYPRSMPITFERLTWKAKRELREREVVEKSGRDTFIVEKLPDQQITEGNEEGASKRAELDLDALHISQVAVSDDTSSSSNSREQDSSDEEETDGKDFLSWKEYLLSEKEPFLERNRETGLIFRSKLKEEGEFWELTEAAAFITFPPKSVIEPGEITWSLWSPRTCSPPLGENEALVSNVIELSCDGLPGLNLSSDCNEGVTLALSHSATDLKGYEVVIRQLMNPKGNEWKDLETKNTWSESGIQGDTLFRTESSGLLFPLAEAKVTQCSSFAAIWRLKSYTFPSNTSSLTDPVFTCTVPEYPDVSVSIPRSDLPESGDFSLTIKVQEVPCDEVKDDGVLVGPILHISSSPDVQFFKEPVTITIPISLREAKRESLDVSSGQLRIVFFNCGAKDPAWREITDEVETPAVKDGVVTFQVKHFSRVSTVFTSKGKRKPPSSEWQHLVKKPKLMPQEAGFLACLRETISSGTLMLTLFCYPLQMKYHVTNTVSSKPNVLCQVQKNGIEKMCKEDKAFVSVMEQIKPAKDKDLENFFLRFLGDELFERDMLVSVQGDGVPKVEIVTRQEGQQEGKLMCELFFLELQMPQSASKAVDCSSSTSTSQTNLCLTSAPMEVQEQGKPSSPSNKKLKVTLLADEWGSSKGGLSTINRELAMHLAKNPRVEVTLLLPHCSDRDKEEARQNNISIVEAEEKAGFEPQDWLSFPPKDLAIDIVIGHGVKLGRQAPIIRDYHKCKCVQVVHTAPEELGMYKSYSGAISKAEGKHQTEVDLCKRADLVVAIGPKLAETFSCDLRSCGKDQGVFSFIPGIFMEFLDVKQTSHDTGKFRVLVFGRGDPEDFLLKGFDIAAQAVAELKDKTYQLLFVGAPEGTQEEVANKLIQFIPKDQLTVRGYVQTRQQLKELFYRVDLAVMPSRTEGFGLTALEALSAGLPVLVSSNSGLGEALQKVQFGSPYVVESDASVWAKAIQSVRMKERELRLEEVTTLRQHYAKKYSWEEQCKLLVEKMWNLADGSS